MATEKTFHNYPRALRGALKSFENTSFHDGNKALVLEFYHYLSSTNMSIPRLIKYLYILRWADKKLKKSFRDTTKGDIIELVNNVQSKGYSVWTVQMYKVILKRFFNWLDDGKYNNIVNWMTVNVRRRDIPLPQEGDLLTEEEFQKMMSFCTTTRDRALLSLLYESGARIGEIGTLKLKDISFDKYGAIITVNGKTGARQMRIIESTQYLMTWLDNHPAKNDRNAPLWTRLRIKEVVVINYPAISKLLKTLAAKAGIKKKMHPHLFRHSRATRMANHFTEFQMNHYFGWIQGSNMPSTYVHLSGKDMDKAVLDFHGIVSEEKEEPVTAKKCPKCGHVNPHSMNNCIRCAGFLDQKAVYEQAEFEEKRKETLSKTDSVLNDLMKDPEVQSLILEKLKESGRLGELVKL